MVLLKNMASRITKETLEHLADLARIDLASAAPGAEEKLLEDLGRIIEYFEELKDVPTDDVSPVTGGTSLENVYREDTDTRSFDREAAIGAFPESKSGFLKIPPVFEHND